MTSLRTRDIQVQICTTYWDREEQKYCHYKGWPGEGDPLDSLMAIQDMQQRKASRKEKPVAKVSLHTALTHHCNSSAYFVQYAPTALNVRFKTGAFMTSAWELLNEIEPSGINMILAIFDVDCHKSRKDRIDEWFAEQKSKLDNLLSDFPDLIIYRSQGGMRILGALPKPLPMDGFDSARNWTRLYGGWCNYLARKYDIKTEGSDTADQLGDWTRFQRVPHDKRHKNDRPTDLPIIGDVEKIGIWNPELEESDYPAVRHTNKSHSTYTGACQLLSLIKRAGIQHEETQLPNAYDIHCPDAANHGTDTEYRSTMTFLYTDGHIGRIECKSSTCQRRHPDKGPSYLQCFDPDDVLATTPVFVSDDALVERLWARILSRQATIGLENFSVEGDEVDFSQPLGPGGQEHDYKLLLKAIKCAAYPDSIPEIDEKSFISWILKNRPYIFLLQNNQKRLNELLDLNWTESKDAKLKEICCEYFMSIDSNETSA